MLARHGIHVSQLAGDVSVDAQAGLVVATGTEAGEGPGAAGIDEQRADGSTGQQAASEPETPDEPPAGSGGEPEV